MTAAQHDRRQRYRRGIWAEYLSCCALFIMGWRIISLRERTPVGEVDIIAVRRRMIIFVEVKARKDRASAEASISGRQRARVRAAADYWLARHPRYHDFEIRFDAMLIRPLSWPTHVPDGL